MMNVSPFQWASFNYFGYFCAYGVLLPFLPVWLKHYGYEAGIIGLIASVGYLFRFLGGMLAAQYAKQPGRLLFTARVLTWINLIVTVLVAFSAEHLWLLFPAIMLFQLFNAGAIPIGDSIASIWQKQIGLDYGKARLFGSLAFVVGSVSTGYLLSWLGKEAVIWVLGAWLLILGLGQLFAPSVTFAENSSNSIASALSYGQIFKQPTHCRMLLASALILGSHAAYYTYSSIYWQSLNVSTQATSLLWGLAVLSETCLFFTAKRFFTKISLRTLLTFAAVGTMLRWAIQASSTDLVWLTFSQLGHAFSFALTHFSMIRYISSQEASVVPKLQGLYFGLGSCAFTAVFTFIAGFIYPHSPSLMFAVMGACVLPVLLLLPRKL